MGIRAFIHGIARIASSQNGSAIAQNRDAPYTVLVGYPANPKAGYRISVRPFLSSSSFLLHIPCDTSSPSLSLLFILSTSFPAPHTFLPFPSSLLLHPLCFPDPLPIFQLPLPSTSFHFFPLPLPQIYMLSLSFLAFSFTITIPIPFPLYLLAPFLFPFPSFFSSNTWKLP